MASSDDYSHSIREVDLDSHGFPDRGPAVLAVASATIGLATLFVFARMVSRIGIVRRVGCDDYIILLAWLIAFFLTMSINFGTKRGLGRHDGDIDDEKRAGLRMCEYIFSILYVSFSSSPELLLGKTETDSRDRTLRSWLPSRVCWCST